MPKDFSAIQHRRMLQQERAKIRWQHRAARRRKGSGGQKKANQHAARCQQYAKDVRHEFAHQTSHQITRDSAIRLIVFEALNIKGMTKRAKAKQSESGKWLKNGAKAKSGLAKGILQSARTVHLRGMLHM